MTNWLQVNAFLTILVIVFTIRLIYHRTKLSLAFLVAITIILIIIVWSIWAVYTHNLPCSMIENLFTINGTEYQNYVGRCGL
jgi:glucan phosphoethanolaminetransferase (alkaline phosphatase superfamily)